MLFLIHISILWKLGKKQGKKEGGNESVAKSRGSDMDKRKCIVYADQDSE